MYLPCTLAQEQAQSVSNIVSNSQLFHSKSIDLPIPKMWLLKMWPWKSKVKVMGDVKVQSHNMSLASYRLTSFWFHINRLSHSWDPVFLKFDLENPRPGHSSRKQSRYNTLSTHIPFVPSRSIHPFLGCSYFKNWRWKFKVKVMGEVKVWSQNMGLTFISFHANRASHSWDTTVSKYNLENSGSRSDDHDVAQVQVWKIP